MTEYNCPKHIIIETLNSTNDYIQENIEKFIGEEWIIVETSNQTQGRGYGKNVWESEPGKNITVSHLFNTEFIEPEYQFRVSKFMSLGIVDFLELFLDDIKIKWPNDIYFRDKKIAGILIENSISGNKLIHSIVGIGLNINQEIFDSRIPNPVSLKGLTTLDYNLSECMHLLNQFISVRIDMLKENPKRIDEDYIKYLYRFNNLHPYKYRNNWFNGRIIGLDDSGRLKIEDESGNCENYAFKEIEYII